MLIGRASISLRLTARFGSIFLLGWVLYGAFMWFNLKHTLTNERYQTASRRLDRLEQLLHNPALSGPGRVQQNFKEFSRATGGGLVEVIRPGGAQVFPPQEAAAEFPWPAADNSRESFVEVDASGQPYWVLSRPSTYAGAPVLLLAASSEANNLVVLGHFWEGLLASAPLLLLVSSLSGYWLSRKALRPVDRITVTARSIGIRNLSERLPATGNHDELERLTETFNAMLERLESAVKQIKQFTADASHELRGPLSFVRTVAEVALRNAKADAESRAAFTDIVDETAKAAVVLEDLLTLARADAESGSTVLEPLDLAAVVEQACEMARPLAAERNLGLAVSLGAENKTRVLGDFLTLRRLLWIVLDNALKYTPAPGRIDVRMTANASLATVEIRDSGVGIPDHALPHIFDRFYRADPSRSQGEGSGLGLSIAKWIADLHRAKLTVASQEAKGTVVRLVLPVFVADAIR